MQPGILFVAGVVIGMAIGGVFGISLGNVALGMPTGACLGLIIGFVMSRNASDHR